MFALPDYTYKVEILRCIDGDTVDVNIDCGFYMTVRKRIRILGIDTEEIRGGTIETKERGHAATRRLEQLLTYGDVYIKTKMDATGKYGRLLGDLYVKQGDRLIDITRTMVAEGYDKGTETPLMEKIVYEDFI